MATTVEITLSDDGKVMVGITDTPADPSSMQPAGSIQDALAMAKHILQPGKADTSQTGMDGGDKSGPMSDGTMVQSDQTAAGNGPPAASADATSATDPRAMWDELANQAIPRH